MCLQEYVLIKHQRCDASKSGVAFVPLYKFKEQAFFSVAPLGQAYYGYSEVLAGCWLFAFYMGAFFLLPFWFQHLIVYSNQDYDFQALREKMSKAF